MSIENKASNRATNECHRSDRRCDAVAADGKEIYAKTCAVCHNNMPPKLGDKAAWGPRIKAGTDALVASTIKGKGAMPPNAGNKSLSEADIRAAVEYLVSLSK